MQGLSIPGYPCLEESNKVEERIIVLIVFLVVHSMQKQVVNLNCYSKRFVNNLLPRSKMLVKPTIDTIETFKLKLIHVR